MSMRNWWITGGNGFLGRHLQAQLASGPAVSLQCPRSVEYDLTQAADVSRAYHALQPEVVIHLAAKVGGIGINREHPAEFFYENLMMGVQLIEGARMHRNARWRFAADAAYFLGAATLFMFLASLTSVMLELPQAAIPFWFLLGLIPVCARYADAERFPSVVVRAEVVRSESAG